MTPQIPFYITLAFVVACSTLPLLVGGLVALGAKRAGLDPVAARRVILGTILGVGIWVAAVLIVSPSYAAAFAAASAQPFRLTLQIPFFVIVGMGASIAAFRTSPSFRAALDGIPLPAVVALQTYRVLGGLFLPLMAVGVLPAHFSNPAGWGDIAVGLFAPIVALALVGTGNLGRTFGWIWNAAGITDLLVAVGMGTGLLASVLSGSRVPPAPALGAYPLILIPAFAVPVSMLLHFLAIRKLASQEQRQGVLRMGVQS